MIVVDSSVWIARLREQNTPATRHLQVMIHEEDDVFLIGDLILLELLQGARDDAHAARIERDLRCFSIVPMMNEGLAIQAARNYRQLRSLGITVRKTAGMIIGTFCMVEGHSLLHDDRDFEPMATHLGLRVITLA